MSKMWEGTDGCAKKYRCVLDVYLITVLSYSYGIIMYCSINAPGNVKNDVYGINAMYKRYLR